MKNNNNKYNIKYLKRANIFNIVCADITQGLIRKVLH